MSQRTFLVCALVVLALELLALGRRPMPGASTAEVERAVAGALRLRDGAVSDVRCGRRSSGEVSTRTARRVCACIRPGRPA
jgi:hypothetical protein